MVIAGVATTITLAAAIPLLLKKFKKTKDIGEKSISEIKSLEKEVEQINPTEKRDEDKTIGELIRDIRKDLKEVDDDMTAFQKEQKERMDKYEKESNKRLKEDTQRFKETIDNIFKRKKYYQTPTMDIKKKRKYETPSMVADKNFLKDNETFQQPIKDLSKESMLLYKQKMDIAEKELKKIYGDAIGADTYETYYTNGRRYSSPEKMFDVEGAIKKDKERKKEQRKEEEIRRKKIKEYISPLSSETKDKIRNGGIVTLYGASYVLDPGKIEDNEEYLYHIIKNNERTKKLNEKYKDS